MEYEPRLINLESIWKHIDKRLTEVEREIFTAEQPKPQTLLDVVIEFTEEAHRHLCAIGGNGMPKERLYYYRYNFLRAIDDAKQNTTHT